MSGVPIVRLTAVSKWYGAPKDATPVLSVSLSGNRTPRETTEYADKILRRQIESTNGVGQVTILGGRSRRLPPRHRIAGSAQRRHHARGRLLGVG